MTIQPKWVIETNILKGTPSESLPSIARQRGYDVFEAHYDFFNRSCEVVPYAPTECVIVYGSYNYVNALKRAGQLFTPGPYGMVSSTTYSIYAPQMPHEVLLNHDYIILPWAELLKRKDFLKKLFPGDQIFVRPNSGFKTFSGFLLNFDEWDYLINATEQTTSVTPETLVIISSFKKVSSEYRFVIADKKVITGSRYHVNGELSMSKDIDLGCQEIADKISKNIWQVDLCYTCDIGVTDAGPKLIELNSFACAGLYECDLEKIVDEISAVSLKEFI